MKIHFKNIIALFLFIILFSFSIHAQKKVYLSGKDAKTAINWKFKLDEGRNSGFWTTIPVPSNWETEGFAYYLYGMAKVEDRLSGIGNINMNLIL